MKNIVIVGAGWYGLHIFIFIKKNYTNFNILILEQKKEIFNNSSNFNQNRLHLGYHYPRSFKTREICRNNYNKFLNNYIDIIDNVDNNFYCISNESFIDYNTYLKIFDNIQDYNHTIISNNILKNIDGNFINTNEKMINSQKAKKKFKKMINKKFIKFNYKVTDIANVNNKIIVNNDLEFDILIDCTYNNLQLQENYIYEFTISLVYIRINHNNDFDSLTIMDGNFFSLYPRDIEKKIYTLTHVNYTPLIKSENINDIINYSITNEKVLQVKINMERDVMKYYNNFLEDFKYKTYFTFI